MKLFTKIIIILLGLIFFIESSNAVLPPRFESYKKSIWKQKVYVVNTYGGKYELKGVSYWTFEYWDRYAHDKKYIYLNGNIKQKRITLDKSFKNFYENIIYTKNNIIYYKNIYDDLVKITEKGDNLKVLYNTKYYIGIRSNNKFYNIEKKEYGFYNESYKLDEENGCDIYNLEYKDGLYNDGKNICGYAYPVPKEVIDIIDEKVIKKLDKNYTLKVNKIHNIAYKERAELLEKINKSKTNQLMDKYLFVGMEHLLEYIDCNIMKKNKNRIRCMDINRRNHAYPND